MGSEMCIRDRVCPLQVVRIMATIAGQRPTLLKTPGAPKAIGLIGGVHASAVPGPKALHGNERFRPLARPEGKGTVARDQVTRVTLGAECHLEFPLEFSGMDDIASGAGAGSFRRVFRMKASRAMTSFAGDSQRVIVPAVDIAQIGPHRVFFAVNLKEGGMAFQATRINRAVEIRLPIRIAGAVDPTLRLGEIGNRQLKEFAASPVEIGLAHFPRSDDDVHALGPRDNSTLFPRPGGLKETVFRSAHLEPEMRIAGAKQSLSGLKTAEYGIRPRKLGGEVVGGLAKAFVQRLMAFPTGRGADIRRAIVAGRRHGGGWLFRRERRWGGNRLHEEERNQNPDQRAGLRITHLIPNLPELGKMTRFPTESVGSHQSAPIGRSGRRRLQKPKPGPGRSIREGPAQSRHFVLTGGETEQMVVRQKKNCSPN